MKRLLMLFMLIFCSSQTMHGWSYTLYNKTDGRMDVRLKGVASGNHIRQLNPGEIVTYDSGGVCLDGLQVYGMADPIADLGTYFAVQGDKCWNRDFYISHVDYMLVDPNKVNTLVTPSQSANPDMIIYPNTGKLQVQQR